MPAEYCVGRRSYLLVDDVGHIQPTGATKNQHGWTKNGHCTAAFQNCKHSTRPPSVASHASVLRGEGETRRDVHGWNHAGPGSRFHHVAFRKPMYVLHLAKTAPHHRHTYMSSLASRNYPTVHLCILPSQKRSNRRVGGG